MSERRPIKVMNEVYYTDRLKLELSNTHIAHEVTEYYIRNKNFLSGTGALHNEEFYTEAFQKTLLERDEINYSNLKNIKFWIKSKTSNDIIGMIAFNEIIMGIFKSCFLSYQLDKDEINKGYMTEAIQKGIEIAFNDIGLHRIEANIMPKNKASLKVVKKLHFHEEGLAKDYLKINDKWEDHLHMVLLNTVPC